MSDLKPELADIPMFYLAFANNPTHPLPELDRESEAVLNILRRQNDFQISLFRDERLTRTGMYDSLRVWGERIDVMHFAGHAGNNKLLVHQDVWDESLDPDGELIWVPALADKIAQAGGMSLFFLNGCATVHCVEALLEAGVKAVIATYADTPDQIAVEFAIQFYEKLVTSNLEQAFLHAKSFVNATGERTVNIHEIQPYRRISWEKEFPEPKDLWGLFYRKDNRDILQWTIPSSFSSAVETYIGPYSLPTNPKLIGRKREIEKLEKRNNGVDIIRGIPGIGKTALAESYFLRAKKEEWFNFFRWFSFELSVEYTFLNGFEPYLSQTQLEWKKNWNPEKFFHYIIEHEKKTRGAKLYVIDGVENEEEVRKLLLLMDPQNRILITTTTQPQNLGEDVHITKLGKMKKREAIRLIQSFANSKSRGASSPRIILEEIAQLVEYHPLLLELSGKLLGQSLIRSPKEILKALRNRNLNKMGANVSSQYSSEEQNIPGYLNVLFKRSGISKEEKEILQFFCLVPDSGLDPAVELTEMMGLKIGKQIEEIERLEGLLNSLVNKGWLMLQGKKLRCHRIVRQFIFSKELPQKRVWDPLYNFFDQNLILDPFGIPSVKSLKWKANFVAFLSAMQNPPSKLAYLYRKLGAIYQFEEKPDLAIEAFEKAIFLAKKGRKYRLIYECEPQLLSCFLSIGRFAEVKDILKGIFGESQASSTIPKRAWNALRLIQVEVLESERKWEEALMVLEKIKNSLKYLKGREHLWIRTYSKMGNVSFKKKDYSTAEKQFARALVKATELLLDQPEHPIIIQNRSNLASVLFAQGEFQKAAIEFTSLKELAFDYYPENHIQIGRLLMNLGTTYMAMETWENAQEALEESLCVMEFQQATLQIAFCRFNLALLHFHQKQMDTSSNHLQEAKFQIETYSSEKTGSGLTALEEELINKIEELEKLLEVHFS